MSPLPPPPRHACNPTCHTPTTATIMSVEIYCHLLSLCLISPCVRSYLYLPPRSRRSRHYLSPSHRPWPLSSIPSSPIRFALVRSRASPNGIYPPPLLSPSYLPPLLPRLYTLPHQSRERYPTPRSEQLPLETRRAEAGISGPRRSRGPRTCIAAILESSLGGGLSPAEPVRARASPR